MIFKGVLTALITPFSDSRIDVSALKKLIDNGSTNHIVYSNLAAICSTKDSFNYQIRLLNKSLEQNPSYAEAYNNRGNAKKNLGDYQGALSDYSKANKIQPRHASSYNNRGRVKYLIGDNQGACSDAKKAVSLGNEESKRILSTSIGDKICGSSRN